MGLFRRKTEMISESDALPGRDRPMALDDRHHVLGRSMKPPYPADSAEVLLGLGCFWGAERVFWQLDGVHVTSVGYAGGYTQHPTYEEVCSGRTGHTEVVQVVYDPQRLPLDALLARFWESHDPTQGMRQGNDTGTQYRSAVYTPAGQALQIAEASKRRYQVALTAAGLGTITTEIRCIPAYYYAEGYHQQYLAKNPAGYCNIGGVGVTCPGAASGAAQVPA